MKKVIVVHAIDTEGPLNESLENRFDRIKDLFGISHIKRTKKNFEKLLKGQFKIGSGIEKKIIQIFSSHLSNHNDDWNDIEEMMDRLNSDRFRKKYVDSFNDNWKFTWHCMDHIKYVYNPRRRTIGYHSIYDYYNTCINRHKKYGDEIEWHFHPMSTYNEANRCATAYFRSGEIFDILTRKIIERNFFPSSFRAGFQAERPDSHWFLEQWIPFDITNMAVENKYHFDKFTDFKNGRSGNWRNSPSDWSIYHPDHDDYQIEGNCRRWIGRSLNVLNRIASINQSEVDKAFRKADKENKPVLMGITGHDWRDLETEVKFVYDLIRNSSKKFKNVKFQFSTVKKGFQDTIWPNGIKEKKIHLKLKFFKLTKKDYPNILVKAVNGKVFGPQPFFAIETKSRNFLFDNLDFVDDNTWAYAFHPDSLPIEDVKTIAVAANDKFGNTDITKLDF